MASLISNLLIIALMTLVPTVVMATEDGSNISYQMFDRHETISRELSGMNWGMVYGFLIDDTNNAEEFITKVPQHVSKESSRILRNLPFAANGYSFSSKDLEEFYSQFAWYKPNNKISSYLKELTEDGRLFFEFYKNESKKKSYRLVQKAGPSESVYGKNIAVAYPYVFLASMNHISVLDVSDPSAPNEISKIDLKDSNIVADKKHLYAINKEGVSVYNLENPKPPVQVGFLKNHFRSYSDLVLKDSHLFVASRGMYIIDVREPSSPEIASLYELQSPAPKTEKGYDFMPYMSDSIYIHENKAYINANGAIAGEWDVGNVPVYEVVDIENVKKPVYLDSILDDWGAGKTIYVKYGFALRGNNVLFMGENSKPTHWGKTDIPLNIVLPKNSGEIKVVFNKDEVFCYDVSRPFSPYEVGRIRVGEIYKSWQYYENYGAEIVGNMVYMLANRRLYIFEMVELNDID